MTERNQRLQEIRERYEASTPGEWESRQDYNLTENDPYCYWVAGHDHGALDDEGDLLKADAEFIAHAHQDIPWLLDEIERLESLIGEPMMDQILGRSNPGGSYTVKR